MFLLKDLARSGLVPEDFPFGAVELPLNHDGQASYRFGITADYWKIRIDRAENKYVGPKGVVPPIATFGEFRGAKLTATVEGYKKALLFWLTTGIPTIVLDGCWSFGELVEDGLVEVKNLASPILLCLTPGQDHLVFFDGDWSTNELVRKALATYRVLLEEHGVKPRFKDLGVSSDGARLGYDDWFISIFGVDRSEWPSKDELLLYLLKKVDSVPAEATLGGALSFMLGSQDRFSNEFLDLNDRGAGSLLIKLIGSDNLKYLLDTGEWLKWEHGRWTNLRVNPIKLVDIAAKYYFERGSVLEGLADRTEDVGKAEQLRSQAKACKVFASGTCSNVTSRGNIIKDLMGRTAIQAFSDDFDTSRHLLGVANGVVDLRTGELREETQEDRITRHCAVDYVPDAGSAVGERDVETFLKGTFGAAHGVEDPVFYQFMQRRLGIALWGGNKLQSFEIWQGAGSDGKSSLALMIQGALGDSGKGGYAASTKPEVIMSSFKGSNPEGASPFLVLLRGARMVFASETRDNASLNEALIKQLSGGEKLLARGNYQDGGSFRVDFTFFLLTNPMPNCHSLDYAMLSRLAIMPFKVQWQRAIDGIDEALPLPMGDSWWVEHAAEDVGVRRYILKWLIDGCVGFFRENRLGDVPPRCREALMTYKDEADVIAHWITECGLEFAPDGVCLIGELYASYAGFTKAGGNVPLSTISFVKRLVAKYPTKVQKKVLADNKRGIKGLRFRE